MAKKNVEKERLREFLAEAEDILNSMGKGLMKLGKGVKAGVIDHSVLNGVFRSAHTLKGMSGIFEFKDMTTLSHSLEDTLDMLRLGRSDLTYEVLDCILDAHALLVKILQSKGGKGFSRNVKALAARLEETRKPRKAGEKTPVAKEILDVLTEYEEHRLRENLREGKNVFIVNVMFPITSFDKGYVTVTDTLRNDSEVIATLPSSKSNSENLYFDILIGTDRDRGFVATLLKEVAPVEVRVLSEKAPRHQVSGSLKGPALEVIKEKACGEGMPETIRRVSNTVRVDIGKLDNILHIITELGVLKTNIARLGAELRGEMSISVHGVQLSRAEKFLERKLTELRDGVLDVRMVPIGQLFGRFDGIVDRLSRDSGKEIAIETYGDETELDKLIVEELADPLMHIIRNVVDHAMETPGDREAAGKPPAGTITLGAYQKANHVVVEVRDDGRGIDVELVKSKAAEKGLVTRDYLATLSRQEALELIFLPGFSTRDTVSETSGRGVGMDVVKENITRLSGIIDIDTEKGTGTRFKLTIPITLAIIQALIVEAGLERYAMPLSSVIEIVELTAEGAAHAEAEGTITVGDRTVPTVRLARFFRLPEGCEKETCYGIISGVAEHRLCVVVDGLVEELDVVIKPLSRILDVPGVAGATDMGEKGVMLVLDVTGILDQLSAEKLITAQA